MSLPLIAIPAREFVIGSSPADERERQGCEDPQRRMRLDGLLMGQTPITQPSGGRPRRIRNRRYPVAPPRSAAMAPSAPSS